MALYREEDPNKLPSINSLSIDDVISGNIKPSTAVSNVQQPAYKQSTVNKNVNLPPINEISLDDIVQTPPKVPQVQQTQQIQQQGITWKETLKYLPGQFTIDNLKKTIPQAIVSTFKGGAKEIAKFLVDVADVALDITPKNFKEKNKLVLDKWRDNLKLEPTEVPGAIAAQIGEVIVGIGVTKAVLTKVPTISKFAKAFPKTFNVVNSGITGATIGQIGMDNEATFKDRVKQAAIDFPTWVAFSATGGIPAKKYYAYLPSYFATGYLSSKLEGADHQDALVSGLMTAAIGGGLHAISKPQQETINKMRQAQLEEANRTLAQYGVYDKTSYLNAMHKYHPDVSKLPQEEAKKITTAINTAWTIKNNPPQAVERSLMQEINDLFNVIKSPDKARAMENIGKTTPPIALIPEQITPEGEVKPAIEPTVGPIKAPTEIKPTPIEETKISPTAEEKAPTIPTEQKVPTVKPPTEGIQPTTTPPTPTVEQPIGGIKPTVKPPTESEVTTAKVPEQPAITPEAETEVKIPEIKPKEVAKPVVGTKIVPKELEPLAKEARKYKSAEEFKKALGKTQGVLWSGRKGGITDLSKPLFTSENPNLALTYSLNYPENLELAEKDLQAFIPKDGKTLDLTTNKKAIQYLKKIGIDVKEGYSVRQTVYNNWNKIINEAKKDGYDYINHIGEDEFAQFLDIETVVLNPQKSLQSLTDFYNQAVKGTKKTKITEEVKPVPKELEPLAKEAKKYKTPEEFIDTLKKQGKIFYHGTPYKFDKFDISRVGERGRTEGRGFYFTDRPEVAKTYTNKPGEKIIPKEGVVIEAYLDIKKPMSVSQRKITDNQLTKIVSELSKTNDSLIPSYGDSVKDVVDALKTNDTDVDIISELGNVGVNAQEINDVVQKITGYDGIIEKTPYGKLIVAFNPSQIKTKSQLTDIWNKAQKLKSATQLKTRWDSIKEEPRNLPTVIRGETFTLGERRTLTPSSDKIKLEYKVQVKATEKEQKLAKIAMEKAQKLEAKNQKIREDTLNNINKYKGETSTIIKNLKKKNLSNEDINNIVLENGVKLVDTVKVKRNNDKSLASVITKEDIKYIKDNYKGEKPSAGFENVNKISEAIDVLKEMAKKYELSAVWFERKGLGRIYDKNINGQRAAQLQKTEFLKRFEKAGLFKKGGWFTADSFNISKVESEHIAKYYIARQNRGYTTKFEDLSPKERTFVEIFDEIIKETEPMFYDVANKVGKKPRKVENYAPIMTSQDIKMVEETGAMDWLFRKHPAFFSLKERTEKAPKDIYETDYRKVVSAWLDGMTQFLNTAEETQDIKYLIESDEFKSIVNARDYGIISKWLQDITTMKKISGVEKTTMLLRKTTAIASLGLNYATVVKQALTLIPIMIIEKAPPQFKSEYARAFGINVADMPSITKRSGDIAISDLQGGIERVFTGAITEADRKIAQISLNALLDKEYAKYKIGGEEISQETRNIIEKEAQDKLDLWYGGFFKGQKPEMFRTPIGNFFNMFIYPLTSQLNGFYRNILVSKGIKGNAKATAEVLTAATVIAYLEVAITNLSFDWDDEEDMAKDVLLSLTGNIPVVSQIAYGLSMDTDIQISAGIGGIQNLLTKISAYYQGEKELKDVFFATGELAGLPKQVRRFYEGMEILQNGGVIDSEGNMMVQVKETDEIVRSFLRGKYGSLASRDWITNIGKKAEERRWFVPEVEFLQNGDYERKAELYVSFDKEKRKELKSFLSENQVKKLNKAIEDFIEKEETMEKIRQKIMEKGLYSKDKVDEIAKKVYEDITSE